MSPLEDRQRQLQVGFPVDVLLVADLIRIADNGAYVGPTAARHPAAGHRSPETNPASSTRLHFRDCALPAQHVDDPGHRPRY